MFDARTGAQSQEIRHAHKVAHSGLSFLEQYLVQARVNIHVRVSAPALQLSWSPDHNLPQYFIISEGPEGSSVKHLSP